MKSPLLNPNILNRQYCLLLLYNISDLSITILSDSHFRSNNGMTYFFKDSQYYRFNDVLHEVKSVYPKPISSFWKGIPNNVDTVFRWSDDQTYFFKGNFYYRFDFTKGAVDDGYPRHVSEGWKGVLYSP